MADPLDVADVFGDPDPNDGPGTDYPVPRRGARPNVLPAAIPLGGAVPPTIRRRLDPAHLEHGIPRLTAEPHAQSAATIYSIDPRGTIYPSVTDPIKYLTTHTVAKEFKIDTHTVWRWCVRWFGKLPADRAKGGGVGYCIPPEYRYVVRAWLQLNDNAKLREQARWALIRQLREWVVLCGDLGSTHHTYNEVLVRLQALQTSTTLARAVTTILHVGPILPEDVDLTQ